jgi:LacI family transcriptional regulator, galactose operon repressor
VTIRDVAARARVSKSTVSNVVRGVPSVTPALRARVEHAIAELGYTPSAVARSLVARRTRTLGVTIPSLEPFYADILQGAEARAVKDGYHLLIGSTGIDDRAPEALLRRRVDGFLVCGVLAAEVIRLIAGYGPVVLVDPTLDDPGFGSVGVDSFLGAQLAVRHLVSLGHRRIAAVIESELPEERTERIAGFRAGLVEAGLAVDPRLELRDAPGPAGRGPGARTAAVRDLLRLEPRPTSVVAGDDLVAIGLIDAFEARGFEVPSDVSIVGFDDIRFARVRRINLTTIRQPSVRIGELGADLLIEQLEGRPIPTLKRLIEPELVIRATTGPPPG